MSPRISATGSRSGRRSARREDQQGRRIARPDPPAAPGGPLPVPALRRPATARRSRAGGRGRSRSCFCLTNRSRRSTRKSAPNCEAKLRDLQKRLGILTIMVTHDQEEALTLADKVVCMQHGRIAQIGPARGTLFPSRQPFRRRFHGCEQPDRSGEYPPMGGPPPRRQNRSGRSDGLRSSGAHPHRTGRNRRARQGGAIPRQPVAGSSGMAGRIAGGAGSRDVLRWCPAPRWEFALHPSIAPGSPPRERCGHSGATRRRPRSGVRRVVPRRAAHSPAGFLRLSPRNGDPAERHAERRRLRFRQLSAHLQHAEFLARHHQLSGDERFDDIARAGLRACRRVRDSPLPGSRPRASAGRRFAAIAGALARAGIGIDLPARAQRHRHQVHRPRHQHLWLLGIADRQRTLRVASGGSHHRRGAARGGCPHLRGRRNARERRSTGSSSTSRFRTSSSVFSAPASSCSR